MDLKEAFHSYRKMMICINEEKKFIIDSFDTCTTTIGERSMNIITISDDPSRFSFAHSQPSRLIEWELEIQEVFFLFLHTKRNFEPSNFRRNTTTTITASDILRAKVYNADENHVRTFFSYSLSPIKCRTFWINQHIWKWRSFDQESAGRSQFNFQLHRKRKIIPLSFQLWEISSKVYRRIFAKFRRELLVNLCNRAN